MHAYLIFSCQDKMRKKKLILLASQYSCLILLLSKANFFYKFNLFIGSDCESGVQLYFTTAPTSAECMISPACFLISIILDAKHKKIVRNNQVFFVYSKATSVT